MTVSRNESPSAASLRAFLYRMVTRKVVNWTDSGSIGADLPDTVPMDQANIVTSWNLGSGVTQKLLLDIDHPAWLVKSSTEGHFHLYVDVDIPHAQWRMLIAALAEAGVIEQGYKDGSLARGFSSLRLPWIKKEVTV